MPKRKVKADKAKSPSSRTKMNRAIYLPMSERQQQAWGVAITAAGHGVVPAGISYPLNGHPADHALNWERGRVIDALQVVYIPEGVGEFETEASGRHRIAGGAVFFLVPGVWHRYRPLDKTGWVEDWIELSGSVVLRLLAERVVDPQRPVLVIGDRAEIRDLFRQCVDAIEQKQAGFEAIAATIGLQILAVIKAVAERSPAGEERRVAAAISRGQSFVTESVSKRIRTRSMATQLGVSESYFRKAFKSQTGLSPKRYHSELRQRQARELLQTTSMTVKEIATMLGYHSPFHFSADFKLRTGVSPLSWRKRFASAPQRSTD